MAAPTIGSVSPTTVVAGAGQVTVTITGTNFAAGAVVSSPDPDAVVTGSAFVDSTHVTAKVAAKPGLAGGHVVRLTVTNTDLGTVTGNGPAVTRPSSGAVNKGAAEYGYANPTPGGTTSVAPGDGKPTGGTFLPVQSKMETTHVKLNPAYDPAVETNSGGQSQGAMSDVQAANIHGPWDAGNPADQHLSDIEGAPLGDHSPQSPAKPAAPTATASGTAGQVGLVWAAPAAEPSGYAVTGYEVVATSSDGGAAKTTQFGAVLSGNVVGLTSAKHYTFTVAAKNARGTGTASNASNSVLTV